MHFYAQEKCVLRVVKNRQNTDLTFLPVPRTIQTADADILIQKAYLNVQTSPAQVLPASVEQSTFLCDGHTHTPRFSCSHHHAYALIQAMIHGNAASPSQNGTLRHPEIILVLSHRAQEKVDKYQCRV